MQVSTPPIGLTCHVHHDTPVRCSHHADERALAFFLAACDAGSLRDVPGTKWLAHAHQPITGTLPVP